MIVSRTRRYRAIRTRQDARSDAWFQQHKDALKAALADLLFLESIGLRRPARSLTQPKQV